MINYNINYSKIPEHCRDGVKSYVERGQRVGDFLTRVFENKLVESFGRADDINRGRMRDYVMFLYNDAPMECWGSEEKVKKWIDQGGLRGLHDELQTNLEGINGND